MIIIFLFSVGKVPIFFPPVALKKKGNFPKNRFYRQQPPPKLIPYSKKYNYMGRQAGDASARAAAIIVEGALKLGPCPREGLPSGAGHKFTRGANGPKRAHNDPKWSQNRV